MADKQLDVYIDGHVVGTLAETPEKLVAFQYSDEWLKTGFDISPFSLPLKPGVFVPKEKNREIFRGLFGVFSDSLPDSWGELLLDRYLESMGINPYNVSVLDRLAYVGKSGMGVLEYYPSKTADFSFDGIDYDILAGECDKILSSQPSGQLDLLYNLGGSSGGTRPKILISDKDTDWIVKFPAKKDPAISGKREYDYSLCVKKCGIPMTKTELVPSDVCEGYFKTERFDRKNGKKGFTDSVSSILEVDFRAPSCDYSTYMKLIQILTNDNKADKGCMYKQMCFNVLSHNRDDHTKNFSFIYTDQYGWRLSPAYDITFSTTYFGEQTTSVNGKGKDISLDDLYCVGKEAGLSKNFCVNTYDEIRNAVSSDLNEYLSEKNNKVRQVTSNEYLKDLEANTEKKPFVTAHPISMSDLTKDQLDTEIKKGMDDIRKGRVYSADDVEEEIKNNQ